MNIDMESLIIINIFYKKVLLNVVNSIVGAYKGFLPKTHNSLFESDFTTPIMPYLNALDAGIIPVID